MPIIDIIDNNYLNKCSVSSVDLSSNLSSSSSTDLNKKYIDLKNKYIYIDNNFDFIKCKNNNLKSKRNIRKLFKI